MGIVDENYEDAFGYNEYYNSEFKRNSLIRKRLKIFCLCVLCLHCVFYGVSSSSIVLSLALVYVCFYVGRIVYGNPTVDDASNYIETSVSKYGGLVVRHIELLEKEGVAYRVNFGLFYGCGMLAFITSEVWEEISTALDNENCDSIFVSNKKFRRF